MIDLTKLTAEELMSEDDELPEWWAEIRHKLERLEQLEKERDAGKTADNPLIQQAAHKISPGVSTIPSMQSEASQHLHIVAAYEQTEVELRERLEQCEADLEQERIQHAGCLTAAEGWAGVDPPKKGDWGWSPAFQAVLDLRKRFEMHESLPEILCCPPHEGMYRNGTTQPLDNCFVCIRNERDELKERLEQCEAAISRAFGKDGCACIKDMPGDNYTCTAHQTLYKIAREIAARAALEGK